MLSLNLIKVLTKCKAVYEELDARDITERLGELELDAFETIHEQNTFKGEQGMKKLVKML